MTYLRDVMLPRAPVMRTLAMTMQPSCFQGLPSCVRVREGGMGAAKRLQLLHRRDDRGRQPTSYFPQLCTTRSHRGCQSVSSTMCISGRATTSTAIRLFASASNPEESSNSNHSTITVVSLQLTITVAIYRIIPHIAIIASDYRNTSLLFLAVRGYLLLPRIFTLIFFLFLYCTRRHLVARPQVVHPSDNVYSTGIEIMHR